MLPEDFTCTQCGHCCLTLGAQLSATADDVVMWEANGRSDILEWVDEVAPGVFDIWISPKTNDDVSRCPWLRKLPNQNKYICRIQDQKPEVCRNYPVSKKHAIQTECEGVIDDK